MPKLNNQLILPRCPHCSVDSPMLFQVANFQTDNHDQTMKRIWKAYACARCGGVVFGAHDKSGIDALEMYPDTVQVAEAIPERAREYLTQAISSLSAPAGAVMLTASSVDAMLKEKGYRDGTLFVRIDAAVSDHVITPDMAVWAHEVRLDANEQRHADDGVPLPSVEDARRVIEFAQALGTFLFVLPSRVQRGIQAAKRS
ncbi:MAG: DUF4145 domain-containing protein [Nitrospiraceae bacterium]